MFIPKIFANEDEAKVLDFIHQNSFGILVNQTNGKLFATHIPLELEENEAGEKCIYGHISKANPQWKDFEKEAEVLVIFNGPHSYISSSWYDHENVPTWNYIAVHVYGKIQIIEGDKLYRSLEKLVDKYEANSKNPVSMEKMNPDYLKKEMKGIVGFEIKIEKIEAKYKLSQNRDKKNFDNIVQTLETQNDPNAKAIAQEMKKI